MDKFKLQCRAVVALVILTGIFSFNALAENDKTNTKFVVEQYVIDNSKTLSQSEVDVATEPYVGQKVSFSDVQDALKVIEVAYFEKGFSAVYVTLREQKLTNGIVHLLAREVHYGQISVHDNAYFSENNIISSLPSLKSGALPNERNIARELKLANANPAKQVRVVLSQGSQEDKVDAKVYVQDTKPTMFNVTLDNTGSAETGKTRLGVSYRNANLLNADHVGSMQIQISPEQIDRVKILGGGYKIPFYEYGGSLDFFAGYSSVNSLVGGLSNFKGGGLLLSTRYNHFLQKIGKFNHKVSVGLDWRKFARIEQTLPFVVVLYNEIVVMPASVTYAADGKFDNGNNLSFNATFAANISGSSNGGKGDFLAYDPSATLVPKENYSVFRYGSAFDGQFGHDWLFRASFAGQESGDILILGEQFRLGGAEAVRGFSEGSESGNSGSRVSLETYTPKFEGGDITARGLAFFDAGQVRSTAISSDSSISSVGVGFRANLFRSFDMRLGMAKIINSGVDPLQRVGDWRAHLSMMTTF